MDLNVPMKRQRSYTAEIAWFRSQVELQKQRAEVAERRSEKEAEVSAQLKKKARKEIADIKKTTDQTALRK